MLWSLLWVYLQVTGMVFQLPHFGVLSYREHLILLNNVYIYAHLVMRTDDVSISN